jgi:hypothetical protein
MKSNHHLQSIIASIGLLTFAASNHAQDSATHFTTNDGTQGTLTSGQPAADHYGPAPPFSQLDIDHDGFVSRDEAGAYLPLLNDFDFVARHANRISKRQFEYWNRKQNR